MARPTLTTELVERGGRLGHRIAMERQRLGLTQAELALNAGVSRQALLKVEQGHVANPGIFTIAAVAAVLDTPIETLIDSAITEPRPVILTMGYEGLNSNQFLDRLTELDAEVVVDVRLNPLSRKPGLSKTRLREAVSALGMEYNHVRALGNPKENRAAFRGQDLELGRERFRALLAQPTARTALRRVAVQAEGRRVVLICFEKDASRCHRSVVAEEIAQLG